MHYSLSTCFEAGNTGSTSPAVGKNGVEFTIQQRIGHNDISSHVTLLESVRPPKDVKKDKNEEIERLRSQVCCLAEELEKARRQQDFLADKFEKLAEETNGLKRNMAAQQQNIKRWEEKNEEKEHQLKQTKQNIVTLQQRISSQNYFIDLLKKEAIMRDRKIESLENVLAEKETVKRDSIIPRLERRLEELSFQYESLEAEKKLMEVRIEGLEMDKKLEAQNLREEIKSLKQMMRELEKFITEVQDLGSGARPFETRKTESLVTWMETATEEFDKYRLNRGVIQRIKEVTRRTYGGQEERANAKAVIAELKRQRRNLGCNMADMAMKTHLDMHIHLLVKTRASRVREEIEKIHGCACQKKTVLQTGLPDKTTVVLQLGQKEKEAIPTQEKGKSSVVQRLRGDKQKVIQTPEERKSSIVQRLRHEKKESTPALVEEKTSVVPRYTLVPGTVPTMVDFIPNNQREALMKDVNPISHTPAFPKLFESAIPPFFSFPVSPSGAVPEQFASEQADFRFLKPKFQEEREVFFKEKKDISKVKEEIASDLEILREQLMSPQYKYEKRGKRLEDWEQMLIRSLKILEEMINTFLHLVAKQNEKNEKDKVYWQELEEKLQKLEHSTDIKLQTLQEITGELLILAEKIKRCKGAKNSLKAGG
ncbi:nucleoprotein TPR-like [Macrobrachium nipponense]|uniref:nucleoprotein TPR-like n=1 Tax=Macrobrachium nipponense TaxID=159736 RepID=UPI0030C8A646